MKSSLKALPLTLAVSFLAVACNNPTVDPASEFSAEGTALDSVGNPVTGAEVRLIRFFHPSRLLRPTVDDLFNCSSTSEDCGYPGANLEIELVQAGQTDMEGKFSFTFKGEAIIADQGTTDASGKREGSNLILLVIDPSDATKRTGIWNSSDFAFQQSDKLWSVGNMRMLDFDATADVSGVATNGYINFGWNKIERPAGSTISNFYRVEVYGNGSRLVVRCKEDVSDVTQGGCVSDGMKLRTFISAFNVFSFYSDNGSFQAYVQGNGVDYAYRAAFSVPAPVVLPAGDPVQIGGIWAVGEGADQVLDNTPAVDGDPKTRQDITNNATQIYVNLVSGGGVPLITDAGLLNSVVTNAFQSCVTVEFSPTASDINAIKTATDWTRGGKFCGGQGADNEVSALLTFETSNSSGKAAAWLRFTAEADGFAMTSPTFQAIGEVGVYARN